MGQRANLLHQPAIEVGKLTKLPRSLTNLQETLTIEVPLPANLPGSLTNVPQPLTNGVPRGTFEVE